MNRRKRLVRATIDRQQQVFEFDIEQPDDKSLVAAALGVKPSKVSNVTHSTSTPTWFRNAATTTKHRVDLVVRP